MNPEAAVTLQQKILLTAGFIRSFGVSVSLSSLLEDIFADKASLQINPKHFFYFWLWYSVFRRVDDAGEILHLLRGMRWRFSWWKWLSENNWIDSWWMLLFVFNRVYNIFRLQIIIINFSCVFGYFIHLVGIERINNAWQWHFKENEKLKQTLQ